MLWKSSNIFEIVSLALFINMPLCWGFKYLASRFFKWWTNKRWRWWWWVMSVFKTFKLTWQGKWKACLDSEIKHSIQAVLYIFWEEQRLVSKCLRQISCRLKISGFVFLSVIVLPIMILIFESPEILLPHDVPVISVVLHPSFRTETWLSIGECTIRHYALISYVLTYILVCYLGVGFFHPATGKWNFTWSEAAQNYTPLRELVLNKASIVSVFASSIDGNDTNNISTWQ